jgi:pimeloyl-ACP methyl ester carboxylesterase
MSAAQSAFAFEEGHVKAEGFRVRYLAAGEGPTLCCFHGAGGLRLSRAHELLAKSHRVVAFETPGFGDSPVNDRTSSLRELGATMAQAIRALGITSTSLWGTSFGAKLALWSAIEAPGLIEALVLRRRRPFAPSATWLMTLASSRASSSLTPSASSRHLRSQPRSPQSSARLSSA